MYNKNVSKLFPLRFPHCISPTDDGDGSKERVGYTRVTRVVVRDKNDTARRWSKRQLIVAPPGEMSAFLLWECARH